MAGQQHIYSYFLLGILAASLYLAYEVLSPFLHIILIGVILASIFHPLHVRLRAALGGRNTLAALCSVLLITLVIILPTLFFLGSLLAQAAKSIDGVQTWLKTANLQDWLKHDGLTPYLQWLQEKIPFLDLDPAKLDLQNNLLNLSKRMGQMMLDTGTRLLGNVLGLLMNFLIMIFVLFFLMRDGEAMLAQIKHLSPLHDAQEERILHKLRDVSRSVVFGSFLVAICQGIVGGIGLAIVGIPALFWGAMMGFASLIPVVGTLIIWGPAALYLFLMGDWKGAAILAAWGCIIISGIDSVLRPMLLQGKANMSTFYVFLSIIGGIQYFGPLGILYGPLTLALAMVLLGIYAEEYSDILANKCDPANPSTCPPAKKARYKG